MQSLQGARSQSGNMSKPNCVAPCRRSRMSGFQPSYTSTDSPIRPTVYAAAVIFDWWTSLFVSEVCVTGVPILRQYMCPLHYIFGWIEWMQTLVCFPALHYVYRRVFVRIKSTYLPASDVLLSVQHLGSSTPVNISSPLHFLVCSSCFCINFNHLLCIYCSCIMYINTLLHIKWLQWIHWLCKFLITLCTSANFI